MGAGRSLSLREHTKASKERASRFGGGWEGQLRSWRAQKAQRPGKDGHPYAEIEIAISSRAPIVELYTHNFLKMITKKEEGAKDVVDFFGNDYPCFEEFEVSERQWERDDKGERKLPPKICPFCLMTEWLLAAIDAKELDWTQLVFRYKGKSEIKKYYAGGLTGLFGARDMSEADKDELLEKDIKVRDSFKQNVTGRLKNIFVVADLADLEKGLQVTSEGLSIGRGMSDEIETKKSISGDKGDPQLHPYPFKWLYYPNARPSDMYKVVGMPEVELSAPALEVVNSEKIPKVFESLRRYPNVKQLEAVIAEGLQIKLPLDKFFAPVKKLADANGWVKDESDKKADSNATSFDFGKNAKSESNGKAPEAAGGLEQAECDNCNKLVPADADQCHHCGAFFTEEAAAAAEAKSKLPPTSKEAPTTPLVDGVKPRRGGGPKGPRGKAAAAASENEKKLADAGDMPESYGGNDGSKAAPPKGDDDEGDPMPWDDEGSAEDT